MSALSALLVAFLSVAFAGLVGRQYRANQRQSHLFWTISLAMSAIGSLGYCVSVWTSPHNAVAFQVYYLFGAMWMPAVMGLGSLALVTSKRAVWVVAVIVLALGLVGSVSLLAARVSTTALSQLNGGAGTGVISEGLWLVCLIVLNTFGAAAVFIVALVSVWQRLRRSQSGRFVAGNIWLAIGVLVISMAGTAARLGQPQLFWLTMLVGWLVTFYGYCLLTPQSASERTAIEVAQR